MEKKNYEELAKNLKIEKPKKIDSHSITLTVIVLVLIALAIISVILLNIMKQGI